MSICVLAMLLVLVLEDGGCCKGVVAFDARELVETYACSGVSVASGEVSLGCG